MKIALVLENSQADKNPVICRELTAAAAPHGHEVINYGMYAASDARCLTYVMNGLLSAIILNTGAADLVVTGLAGIRPSEGNKLTVNPLLPQGTWDWFCLDAVPYHGHIITVLWDVDGRRYGRGSGLTVLVDGVPAGNRADIGKLEITL